MARGDIAFDLGHGLIAHMPRSYLIWLRRPTVNLRLVRGKTVDLEIKVVNAKKGRGRPHILVGHRHTDERPWGEAQHIHPVGSRSPAKVLEFVPSGAIVDLGSGFWGWLPHGELSWIESLHALDTLRRGDVFDVVVHSFDQDKRRILVSRRRTEPQPAQPTGSEFPLREAASPQPQGALVEGALFVLELSRHERNPVARVRCLAHYGEHCVVCHFDARTVYGPEAAGVIHVHHLTPLADIGEAYEVDPISDLRPVCPNCHAVIHVGGGTRPLDEVRQLLTAAKCAFK
ncbi:MAG TPA: S1 RNA-binding domain-containing protein [Urbifossiella sp.]|nr:S1 RNA-binding domain-containing protein [Urbifossiella sp.]